VKKKFSELFSVGSRGGGRHAAMVDGMPRRARATASPPQRNGGGQLALKTAWLGRKYG